MRYPCSALCALFAAVAAVSPLHAALVRIGKMQAKIVPEQVATLSFAGKGMVSDLVLDTSRTLEKGTVVGIMDKEKSEEAREELELQIARERITKRDEIRKLQAQREKLKFYNSLSDSEKRYAQDVVSEESGLDTVADIDEKISLLRRELSTMERRKRAEFDNKHDQYTLRMPFTGRVQYNFTLPEDPSKPFEYAQGGLRPFATVCDDTAFYISLGVNDADLSLLPEDRFSACISLPSGGQIRGAFSHRRVEKNNNGGDMLVYFFKVPVESHETAYSMMGSNPSAVLYYSVEDDVQVVPKSTLLMHPEASVCESWKELVSKAYPGYIVVIVTEREVLIRNQEKAASNS